jgi:hypothetical protein
MSRLGLLVDQIRSARAYTTGLIDTIDPADWFRQPAEGVTHVAWQVGHIAMAQYRLALERFRGTRPDDARLISTDFLALFARRSVPDPDPGRYPPPAAIRAVFEAVHRQALEELNGFPDERLDEPPTVPHELCPTKQGVLVWCNQHEMLHAGQIGLLRRLLGHPRYR